VASATTSATVADVCESTSSTIDRIRQRRAQITDKALWRAPSFARLKAAQRSTRGIDTMQSLLQ